MMDAYPRVTQGRADSRQKACMPASMVRTNAGSRAAGRRERRPRHRYLDAVGRAEDLVQALVEELEETGEVGQVGRPISTVTAATISGGVAGESGDCTVRSRNACTGETLKLQQIQASLACDLLPRVPLTSIDM